MEGKWETRNKVKQMMKYNPNQLFEKPPVFEWPPISYDANESCGWKTIAEGIIGDKYSARKSLYQYRREIRKKVVSKHKFKRRQGFASLDKSVQNEIMTNLKQNLDTESRSKYKFKHHVSFKIKDSPIISKFDNNKLNEYKNCIITENSVNFNTKSLENASRSLYKENSSVFMLKENQYEDNIRLLPISTQKSPKKNLSNLFIKRLSIQKRDFSISKLKRDFALQMKRSRSIRKSPLKMNTERENSFMSHNNNMLDRLSNLQHSVTKKIGSISRSTMYSNAQSPIKIMMIPTKEPKMTNFHLKFQRTHVHSQQVSDDEDASPKPILNIRKSSLSKYLK